MIRIFRHYIPIYLVFIGFIEFLILLSAIYIGVEFRFMDNYNGAAKLEPLLPKALVFSISLLSLMIAFGLYQRHQRENLIGVFARIFASFLVGMFFLITLFYLVPDLYLGRGAFGISIASAFFGVLFSRFILLSVVNKYSQKKRVLVVGSGKKANALAKQFSRNSNGQGFQIIGFIQLPEESVEIKKNLILNYQRPLFEIAQRFKINEIVVAVDDRRRGFPVQEILDCKLSGVDVVDLLTFYERQTGRITLEFLQPSWLIFSDGFRQGMRRQYFKRILDIFASLFLLLFAWPVMLLTAVAIFIESKGKGNILYKQIRVGEKWKQFHILKFRSMISDAEGDGQAKWAATNDSRITKVGAFIRKTRFDELPQILNILKGDMSFVGPRPERPEFVKEFCKHMPYYSERHRVKPGLTGWAQIRYPYGASEQDTIEKLQYDLYYVKNNSLFLDLTIAFQTVEVVFWHKGAR